MSRRDSQAMGVIAIHASPNNLSSALHELALGAWGNALDGRLPLPDPCPHGAAPRGDGRDRSGQGGSRCGGHDLIILTGPGEAGDAQQAAPEFASAALAGHRGALELLQLLQHLVHGRPLLRVPCQALVQQALQAQQLDVRF